MSDFIDQAEDTASDAVDSVKDSELLKKAEGAAVGPRRWDTRRMRGRARARDRRCGRALGAERVA
jgi:hypothetical protein